MLKYDYSDQWTASLKRNGKQISQMIKTILNSYDADDCLYGLFRALSNHQPRISPFIATHDYCIKLLSFDADGTVEFEISPIYHLGPEYIDEYRKKHGKELDEKAVVGLVELDVDELPNPEHKSFRLGINAGIVFKNSKIPHNKKMILSLKPLSDGMMANLSCETQVTSKKFDWRSLNLNPLTFEEVRG